MRYSLPVTSSLLLVYKELSVWKTEDFTFLESVNFREGLEKPELPSSPQFWEKLSL